jgi:hypothetical protein
MIPDKAIALRMIERINAIGKENEFAYEKIIWEFFLIGHLPVIVVPLGKNTKVIRSRTHDDGQDFFRKISDVTAPPAKYISSFARCNRPNQRKFYCSETRPTSYSELANSWFASRNIGDQLNVTVTRWIVQKNFSVIIIPIPDIAKREHDFEKSLGKYYDTDIQSFTNEYKEFCFEFFNFLSSKYKEKIYEDKFTYLITTAYANVALKLSNADGIIYPSVRLEKEGLNFCFNEAFIDNLKLASVHRDTLEYKLENGVRRFHEAAPRIDAKSFDITSDQIFWE